MLDTKFIRENIDAVRKNTEIKHANADIDGFVQKDSQRRAIITEVESLKNRRNIVSEDIAKLKKAKENADALIAEMKTVSERIKELDGILSEIEAEMATIALYIPNMLHSSVPEGATPAENVEIRRSGNVLPQEWRKNHVELAKNLGLIDFERGTKLSGSGFPLFTNMGARLERALINFMLDVHTNEHGYVEVMPPFAVNEASMRGTGQLPKFAEDMYRCADDDLYLIPTAEVPITNIYRDEILPGAMLTLKHCGYSACFRREAGSYGKDTRGLLRLHQFNKVELVKFTKPEDSYNELEALLQEATTILDKLGIPYRVILLCGGDTGFGSAKTYDIEVWSAAEQKWLEVSSCSNFEDFQARRAGIKFRREPNAKTEFVHTLNGSGLATPRLVVALLEHYQQEDGSVRIPEALVPYMNGKDYIRA